MSDIDHFALDGHALRLFLAVLDEGSVTAAATRLGLTQSAVSHNLQKLRRVLNDPLFVKSGRGIVATAHARALREPARQILDAMKDFAQGARFDPASARLSLTIAANDFQRDLLLPSLFRRMEALVKDVTFRIIPSDLPTADMLREGRCDLLISPYPPLGSDIFQKRLLLDHYVCFYDPEVRAAPASAIDYQSARHVTVVYPDNERLGFDKRLEEAAIRRQVAVSVSGFAGVTPFLKGTAMLASLPSLYTARVSPPLASAPLPFDAAFAELPMYMAWHQRFQNDPAHNWLRGLLLKCAADVTSAG